MLFRVMLLRDRNDAHALLNNSHDRDVMTDFKIKIRCLILHGGSDGADVFRAEVNSVSHHGRLRTFARC